MGRKVWGARETVRMGTGIGMKTKKRFLKFVYIYTYTYIIMNRKHSSAFLCEETLYADFQINPNTVVILSFLRC